MVEENVWKAVRRRVDTKGKPAKSGALNVAMLFGLLVVGVTLLMAPMLNKKMETQFAQGAQHFDDIKTGSIVRRETSGSRSFTVRRSVLQDMPGAVCIINSDGSSSGC